ncbi:hypothetical protein Barb6XT_01152 [Bacteroidales bacterium Barb6XT]|nr:hypothetical protein Barb6XT_01152 [Bacteroidales bacterium Barb6XT]
MCACRPAQSGADVRLAVEDYSSCFPAGNVAAILRMAGDVLCLSVARLFGYRFAGGNGCYFPHKLFLPAIYLHCLDCHHFAWFARGDHTGSDVPDLAQPYRGIYYTGQDRLYVLGNECPAHRHGVRYRFCPEPRDADGKLGLYRRGAERGGFRQPAGSVYGLVYRCHAGDYHHPAGCHIAVDTPRRAGRVQVDERAFSRLYPADAGVRFAKGHRFPLAGGQRGRLGLRGSHYDGTAGTKEAVL